MSFINYQKCCLISIIRQSECARVFGYTVYRKILNLYFDAKIVPLMGLKCTLFQILVFCMNWRENVRYIGIPLPLMADPDQCMYDLGTKICLNLRVVYRMALTP